MIGASDRRVRRRRREPRPGAPDRDRRVPSAAGNAQPSRCSSTTSRRRRFPRRPTTSRWVTCTGGRACPRTAPSTTAGARSPSTSATRTTSRASSSETSAPGLPPRVRDVPLTTATPLRTLRGTVEELRRRVAEEPALVEAWLRVFVREPARAGLREEVVSALPNAVDVRIDPEMASARPSAGAQRTWDPDTRAAVRRLPRDRGGGRRPAGRPVRRVARPGDDDPGGLSRCSPSCSTCTGSPCSGTPPASTSATRTSSRWSGRPGRASPRSSTRCASRSTGPCRAGTSATSCHPRWRRRRRAGRSGCCSTWPGTATSWRGSCAGSPTAT